MTEKEENLPNWAAAEPVGGQRSLPVYLLIDTSSSMDGAPIEAVRTGLEQFRSEVMNEPFARDTVKVGVITYSSTAQLIGSGLVPISDFQVPDLTANGVTRLDLAFEVLMESIDRDVVPPVKHGQKGDWRPMVFVLTDGKPTDDQGYPADNWQSARARVMDRPKGTNKPSAIVSFGCGLDSSADSTLKGISTGSAFRAGKDPAVFVAIFGYVTRSVVSSVDPQAANADPQGKGVDPNDPFANIPMSDDIIRIP